MIYLDNASSTPVLENVAKVYEDYLTRKFFNSSAIYGKAVDISNDINEARQVVANYLGSSSKDSIIFTSCATEANNLAILGSIKSTTKKIILSKGDHPSTYNVGKYLLGLGYNVEFCGLQQNGEIDYLQLEQMLDETVSLVSVIHISNETGAINDLKRISQLINKKCKNAIFHADGVQAFGKIKINVEYYGVDLYTISGHKMHAPKGIACLYVKDKNKLKPLIYGGGQEYNLKSGTENVGAIMGLKTAIEEIGDIKQNYQHVSNLKNIFLNQIKDIATVNSNDNCSPYVISLSFSRVKGETLVHMMEKHDILISTGSACSSKKVGNKTLEAMGITNSYIIGSVRVSFNKYITTAESETAGKILRDCYENLIKKLS